ncbi:MAG: MmcQ/YjbR family DNA-binding protein [bacterium]|nr:MmcQ/YjbR family DNA-binding protein [bacterium]
MATFEDVRRFGRRFPEATDGTFYGTAALKVRGKGFCRMWSEREHDRDGVADTEVLVVFCEPEAKEALLENHPDVLFSTPHYEGHGAMLVRLAEVNLDDLAEWLEDSYRRRAPAVLRRKLDDA